MALSEFLALLPSEQTMAFAEADLVFGSPLLGPVSPRCISFIMGLYSSRQESMLFALKAFEDSKVAVLFSRETGHLGRLQSDPWDASGPGLPMGLWHFANFGIARFRTGGEWSLSQWSTTSKNPEYRQVIGRGFLLGGESRWGSRGGAHCRHSPCY